jgi:hypothetical protein
MGKVTGSDPKNTLYCSFCGKSQHEVRKLIAGPSVFICDECVELCVDIGREATKSSLAKSRDGIPIPKCPSGDFLILSNHLDSMDAFLILDSKGASGVDGQEPGEVQPRPLEISERPDR